MISRRDWGLGVATWMALPGASGAAPNEGGGGLRVQALGAYDLPRLRRVVEGDLQSFLASATYPTQPLMDRLRSAPVRPVNLYRLHYTAAVPELKNRRVPTTALLALPEGAAPGLPLLSYQHGTVFETSSVPSQPEQSYETQLAVAVMASRGYAVVAPDYVGLGESALPNAFFIPGATVQACMGAIAAARAAAADKGCPPDRLFLLGWSQGGYNTLLLLRELERQGQKVAAACTTAAPTDVRLWCSRLMCNPQAGDAPWLVAAASNLLVAAETYELPGLVRTAIRAPYQKAARSLYRFEIGIAEFMAKTPPTLADFLSDEFRASGTFGESPFWRLLDRRQAYRWSTATPLRNYYALKDEVVPAEVAQIPAAWARLVGGKTESLPTAEATDHRGAYAYALSEVGAWMAGHGGL